MKYLRKTLELGFSATLLSTLVLTACGGGGAAGGNATVINGIAVPPMPDVILNQSTVAGVDSDNNGVRDDIDRKIATDFGAIPSEYTLALNHAKTLQAALLTASAVQANSLPASSVEVTNHVSAVSCAPALLRDRLKADTLATLNTGMRQAAYGNAFAGVVLRGCQ